MRFKTAKGSGNKDIPGFHDGLRRYMFSGQSATWPFPEPTNGAGGQTGADGARTFIMALMMTVAKAVFMIAAANM